MIEGFSLPSQLKSEGFSILAKGLLGLGSQGVPSTLVHSPTWLLCPTILYKTRLWSKIVAPLSTIDSRIRTPGPITAPAPMLTFGPSWKYIRNITHTNINTLQKPGFSPRPVHVELLVDRFFSLYFSFSLSVSFHWCSKLIHLSVTDTIQSQQLTPSLLTHFKILTVMYKGLLISLSFNFFMKKTTLFKISTMKTQNCSEIYFKLRSKYLWHINVTAVL